MAGRETLSSSSRLYCDSRDFNINGGQHSSAGRDHVTHGHSVMLNFFSPSGVEGDPRVDPGRALPLTTSRNLTDDAREGISEIAYGQPGQSQIQNGINMPPRLLEVDMAVVDMVEAELALALANSSSPSKSKTKPKQPDIYTRLMLQDGHGYPLYHPEAKHYRSSTHQAKGILIGDVGSISRQGSFDFLFNVNPSYHNQVNPGCLPDEFETLPPFNVSVLDCFGAKDDLMSKSVSQTKDVPIVTYECSDCEGAVLQLPTGATQFEAENLDPFYDIASRHAENWYKYLLKVKGSRGKNGDLYLITGCIKAMDWGIGVFYGPSAHGNYLKFIPKEEGPRTTYEWRKKGPILAKTSSSDACSGNHDDEPNQSLFLMGLKITIRQDLWDDLAKVALSVRSSRGAGRVIRDTVGAVSRPRRAAASGRSHQVDGRAGAADQLQSNQNFETERVSIEDIPGSATLTHPSDYINAFLLLQEPSARVAVTHDSDWCGLLPEDFTSDPTAPKIGNLLRNSLQSRLISVTNGLVTFADRRDIMLRKISHLEKDKLADGVAPWKHSLDFGLGAQVPQSDYLDTKPKVLEEVLTSDRTRYRCESGYTTKRSGDMTRHRQFSKHSVRQYKCFCGREYSRKDSLARHQMTHDHETRTRPH